MRFGRSLLLIGLAASVMSPLAVVGVDIPTTAPTTAPSSPLDAVQKAPNPSAAVEAYARAVAPPHDKIELQQAYVRKMVDFSMPELAEVQAQNLIEHAPENALPWAVTAYMAAARGEPAVALANLETALRKDPDDAFILRTAGQTLAWYDTEADKSKFSDATKSNADFIRNQTKSYALFIEAYRDAMDARSVAPATKPGTIEIVPTSIDYPPPQPTGPRLIETYSPPVYSDPYEYDRRSYLYQPSVIIVRDRDHHRHRSRDFNHDRGRDRHDWNNGPTVVRPTNPPKPVRPAQPEVGKPFFQPRDTTRVVPSTPGKMGPERAPAASKSGSVKSSGKSDSKSSDSKSSGSSSSGSKSSGSRGSSKTSK